MARGCIRSLRMLNVSREKSLDISRRTVLVLLLLQWGRGRRRMLTNRWVRQKEPHPPICKSLNCKDSTKGRHVLPMALKTWSQSKENNHQCPKAIKAQKTDSALAHPATKTTRSKNWCSSLKSRYKKSNKMIKIIDALICFKRSRIIIHWAISSLWLMLLKRRRSIIVKVIASIHQSKM